MPPPISVIDHVAVTTPDVDRLVAFYARTLGALVLSEHEIDGVVGVTQLTIGATMLNIHRAGHSGTLVATTPTPGSLDLCLRWDGAVADAIRWLDRVDVPRIAGPVPRVGSSLTTGCSVYFRDPDGNLLELLASHANTSPAPE